MEGCEDDRRAYRESRLAAMWLQSSCLPLCGFLSISWLCGFVPPSPLPLPSPIHPARCGRQPKAVTSLNRLSAKPCPQKNIFTSFTRRSRTSASLLHVIKLQSDADHSAGHINTLSTCCISVIWCKTYIKLICVNIFTICPLC